MKTTTGRKTNVSSGTVFFYLTYLLIRRSRKIYLPWWQTLLTECRWWPWPLTRIFIKYVIAVSLGICVWILFFAFYWKYKYVSLCDIVGIEVLRLFTNLLICLCRRFYLSKYQICRQGCRSTWTGQWSRSTWPRTTLACHQTTSHQVPPHHGGMFHIWHFDLFSYLPNRRVLQRLYTKYHHILIKNPSFPGQFFTGWCEAQSSPER